MTDSGNALSAQHLDRGENAENHDDNEDFDQRKGITQSKKAAKASAGHTTCFGKRRHDR